MWHRHSQGQALLDYVLLVFMATMAVMYVASKAHQAWTAGAEAVERASIVF